MRDTHDEVFDPSLASDLGSASDQAEKRGTIRVMEEFDIAPTNLVAGSDPERLEHGFLRGEAGCQMLLLVGVGGVLKFDGCEAVPDSGAVVFEPKAEAFDIDDVDAVDKDPLTHQPTR
jgi:hypothetical protein